MLTLFHHPLCPHSRFVRIATGEYGLNPTLVEERPWERRNEFLVLNPAGTTPVLLEEGHPAVPGASIIAEYLDETRGVALGSHRLLPVDLAGRVEVRRLLGWFNDKFYAEVSGPLVTERVLKRLMTRAHGGGAPEPDAIRAALSNIKYHLDYISWLVRTRDWLAGERLSYADLAAAAHLSVIDYLGDVPDLRRSRLLTAPADIRQALAKAAKALGFDAVAVASPALAPQVRQGLAGFLAQGLHGEMDWMAARPERRGDPRILWPDARSIVMLGVNYGPDHDPTVILAKPERAAISVYANGDDYHDVIKKRLKALARWLVAQAGGDARVFVDTAAVMEKPLAAAAGLGWQGKHTNLVSREFGSWLFLGALFTTLELPPDAAEPDRCGTCSACLNICPTAAFPAPYRLDARRCISYLTIEHKGPIPRDLRALMGNRIYGCDDCLAVCPWNKFAQQGREAKLAARDALMAPRLADLARLDDAAFRALFAKSPVKRTGRDRFVRNVLIAIGNSGDPALAAVAEERLDDAAPLVRGAAVWALSRLAARERLVALAAARREAEADPVVAEEWATVLG